MSYFIAYVLIFYFLFTNINFSKINECSFCNKITQDFAEIWEIFENFEAKTKTEDAGFLKK